MNALTNYIITVEIQAPLSYECARSQVEIDPREMRFIEPIDICSDETPQMMTGSQKSQNVEDITEKRKALAEKISRQITEEILKNLESFDTKNGYPT